MPATGQMETDGREVDTELRPTKESATLYPEETTETASQSVSALQLNGNEASQPALLAILTEEIKSLRSLFVEFSVEMADREVRYTRTVDTLSRKVVCLEDKVQELQKKRTKPWKFNHRRSECSQHWSSPKLALPTAVPLQADPPHLATPLPPHWKATANNHHPGPQTDSKLDNQTT